MLLPVEYAYYCPKTLTEACELFRKYNSQARLLAGGTDLILAMKREEVQPKVLIDISRLPELMVHTVEGNRLRLGAALTFSQVGSSPLVSLWAPALAQAVRTVGSPQIRNVGTIGGNIATASPAGDSLPALVAHQAEALVENWQGQRRVTIESLLQNPDEALKPGEIIREIQIPAECRPLGYFLKLGRRNALAISRMSVAIVVFIQGGLITRAYLAIGAVAPYPLRLKEAESIIVAGNLAIESWSEVVEKAVVAVRKAVVGRASAPYKTIAIEGLILEALEEIADLCRGTKI
ncbi:FAD-binding, type 2 [Moorella glycerini]|uniref:Nicotinate dehydrogenase FAD-subunit n=1 Tax=Neomoorella stamsii TaxID=1266720 RepID=A0A9X7J394_9FIRM|nr:MULTISPECIES: xanthine dehydrogenase family protein subunit M [Moorella]PRR73427.1 Nicotinate dehydrogenase FAD-subunit [Moorella stamsii]CEP69196.1 FAD-binding, type 2 [Moorella glycerini]